MLFRTLTATLAAATLAAAMTLPALAQDRALTNVTGDVWRFQNKFHFSVVVVTSAGMLPR